MRIYIIIVFAELFDIRSSLCSLIHSATLHNTNLEQKLARYYLQAYIFPVYLALILHN